MDKKKASLPSLGAWIETHIAAIFLLYSMSLPSLGAWIETLPTGATTPTPASRSLHWERGLKLQIQQ